MAMKKRFPLKGVMATLIFAVVLLILIVRGFAKLPAGAPVGGVKPSSQPAYAPQEVWKTWRDGDVIDQKKKSYLGYSVDYPRDFDVSTGDNANGNQIGTARVKLSFPVDSFATPKSTYGEAYLTVASTADAKTVRNCYQDPSGSGKQIVSVDEVNGVAFRKADLVGAAAGNIYTSQIFRTIRSGRCYEIALTVHTSNIGNYDPGTVVEFDKEPAFNLLRSMFATFKFTNVDPNAP